MIPRICIRDYSYLTPSGFLATGWFTAIIPGCQPGAIHVQPLYRRATATHIPDSDNRLVYNINTNNKPSQAGLVF